MKKELKWRNINNYDNSDNNTMPRFLNKWELEISSDDASYDDCMPGFLNRCEMDDSYNDESDKCDNVNKKWRME